MNTNELCTIITALSDVVEKSFALAEANAKRRHEEVMYQLETARITANTEARLNNAKAAEIESRVQGNK